MVTVRPFTVDDADTAYRLRRIAFGGPREGVPGWMDPAEAWTGLIAEADGEPCGFLRVWDYRQFFGGVAVPMGGVASVTVDPTARGLGVASALLTSALTGMRERGQSVSTLFASVPPLYRRFGWEVIGAHEHAVLPISQFAGPWPAATRRIRRATEADLPAVHDSYLRLAAGVDGLLDRSAPAFSLAGMLEMDIVDLLDDHSGHLIAERPDGLLLKVHDLVAHDLDAAHTLMRHIGTWAGQLKEVSLRLVDPVIHDLVLARPVDYDVSVHSMLLRVVDLPAAVAARGWPAALTLRPFTVDIEVVDEHAPWHAGRHRIGVDGDSVFIEPGGSGEVTLTARALGAWYAGSTTTATLRRAGLLSGDQAAAAKLDALTGAPRVLRIADTF